MPPRSRARDCVLISLGGIELLDDVLEVLERVGTLHRNAVEYEAGNTVEAVFFSLVHIRGDAIFYGLAFGFPLASINVDAEVLGGLLKEVHSELVLVLEEDVVEYPCLLRRLNRNGLEPLSGGHCQGLGRQGHMLEDEAQIVAVLLHQFFDGSVAGPAVGALKVRVLDQSVLGIACTEEAGLVVDRGPERVLEGVLVCLLLCLLCLLPYTGLLLDPRLVDDVKDGLLIVLDRLDEDVGILPQGFLEFVARDVLGLGGGAGQNRNRQRG